jgi:uncharacterized protein (DUF4415 family)
MKKRKVNPELIDVDSPEWTDEMFADAVPLRDVFPELAEYSEKRKAGRPRVAAPKRSKSFKLSPALIEAIVASGKGYNARVEKVLFKALEQGLV